MKEAFYAFWNALMASRWPLPVLLVFGLIFSCTAGPLGLLNPYAEFVLIVVGINIILTASLNLVNGYMGEFSVGHAGLMAVGAYTASVLTVLVFPRSAGLWCFPFAILSGGLITALVGLMIAFPSFKTRGDYLAIMTLALNMIVKSAIENVDAVGGPRGFMGMARLTNLPWTFFWTVLTLWVMRNFIYSKYGRGVLSIREDEIAGELMGVSTRRVKLLVFTLSSFFAGVAGGLYAHQLQVINPRSFDLVRSTEILIMVYLGGIGSITGSVLGATIFTLAFAMMGGLDKWRMIIISLTLVLLMIFRPRGIMGLRELQWLVPRGDRVETPPKVSTTGHFTGKE